ncbi:TetR/AcrR family transcriptional regulator [Enterococcus sp. DIV0756]|uniref:TetR/AcrR family transcriptional regulator n=1 Tax=Enterococcus sp. DIV0756 TaxID=2774636 RepID=UPI003F28B872
MPKIVTEQERENIKESIYEKTKQLIKDKGIKAIIVNDIVQSVGIGKGSFYTYYPSREACLYEVIKRYERETFTQIEEMMSSAQTDKERVIQLLKKIFASPDSLFTSINQFDVEVLLRKLPPEYMVAEKEKMHNNFQRALQFLNLNEQCMETVAILTDCLSHAANSHSYSQEGINASLDILINAIANYVTEQGGVGNE